jgi:hypothetical protein
VFAGVHAYAFHKFGEGSRPSLQHRYQLRYKLFAAARFGTLPSFMRIMSMQRFSTHRRRTSSMLLPMNTWRG